MQEQTAEDSLLLIMNREPELSGAVQMKVLRRPLRADIRTFRYTRMLPPILLLPQRDHRMSNEGDGDGESPPTLRSLQF